MFELDVFGEKAVLDHIGLAVRSIRDAVGDKAEIFTVEPQKVSVAFIKMNGLRMELIEPLGEDTPIASNLKKGQQLVHICFRVPDMDKAVKKGRENGFHCIAPVSPAVAIEGKRITWVYSRVYGLFELVED